MSDIKLVKKLVRDHKKWLERRGGSRADFTGMHLNFFNFSNCRLDGAIFRWCKLGDAKFDRASLDGCDFVGSDMTRVDMRYARATNSFFDAAIFDLADLKGTDFSGSTFKNAVMHDSNVSFAIIDVDAIDTFKSLRLFSEDGDEDEGTFELIKVDFKVGRVLFREIRDKDVNVVDLFSKR